MQAIIAGKKTKTKDYTSNQHAAPMNAAAAPMDPVLPFNGDEAAPGKTTGNGVAWPSVGEVPLIPPVGIGITPVLAPVPVAVGKTPVTNPVPVPLIRPVPEGRTPVPVPVGRGKPAVP